MSFSSAPLITTYSLTENLAAADFLGCLKAKFCGLMMPGSLSQVYYSTNFDGDYSYDSFETEGLSSTFDSTSYLI